MGYLLKHMVSHGQFHPLGSRSTRLRRSSHGVSGAASFPPRSKRNPCRSRKIGRSSSGPGRNHTGQLHSRAAQDGRRQQPHQHAPNSWQHKRADAIAETFSRHIEDIIGGSPRVRPLRDAQTPLPDGSRAAGRQATANPSVMKMQQRTRAKPRGRHNA